MKKTIFTVLLSVFIIYLVGTMLFTPKSDAYISGGILGPIDVMLMCCEEIQQCCVGHCSDLSGTRPYGTILLGDIYEECVNDCIDTTRYICDAYGQNHT